jgi:hypothetical protein
MLGDNMKKIILLTLILLLCSCSANYKIVIEDNKIYDEINITEKSTIVNSANQEQMDSFEEQLIDWERDYDYYTRELFTENDLTGYKYTYDFNFEQYDTLSQISKCYEDFKVTYNNNSFKINTSNDFLCGTYYDNIDKLEITITSQYKVLNSNADKKVDDKYIWIINGSNYRNKPINIEIDLSEESEEKPKRKLNIKAIIFITIFILLIVINIVLKKKEKTLNN